MTTRKLPGAVALFLFTACADLAIFTLMRAAFWGAFNVPSDPLPGGVLLKSFYIGFKFDLRLALLINLPVLMFSWIRRMDPSRAGLGRWLWTAYLLLVNLAVLIFYTVDFAHYAYLQSRLNITAVRFLQDLMISLQWIWETYPVVWGLLGLALLLTIFGYATSRVISRLGTGRGPGGWKNALAFSAVSVLVLLGIYGKFSHYPLRWSDAFFSTHPFSSSLSVNPVLFFFDTMGKSGKSYDVEATRDHYDMVARYLGVNGPDPETLDFSRRSGRSNRVGGNRPNVIVVLLESYAFHKTGLSGNPLSPTPRFDAIARDSLLFRRFYVPSAGTARSVFSLVTGIPDVETRETSSRNPLIVEQHTIINAFEGYEKYYFLGGSANWANIRGLLARNIPGLRIYEEGSYSSPRIDVWGISDLHLFEEASRILGDARKPFFAIIHTSGNHRPYTIPEDSRGFEPVEADDAEVREYGFISAREFNSFRFMDHSIGHFMDEASKEDYFDNTIFVFLGDHGLPGVAAHMPGAEWKLALTRNHVPLVIYAPWLIKKGRVSDRVASEVDVLPTVASLASVPYLNTTLGRDLLEERFDSMRYAFTVANQSTVPEIGLIGDEFYFVMNSDGSGRRLHRLDSETPRENVAAHFPDAALRMERLCRGLYETSRYMPYFNAPEREAPDGPKELHAPGKGKPGSQG